MIAAFGHLCICALEEEIMSGMRLRALSLVITLGGLFGILQACGTEEEGAAGSGFSRCITINDGYLSCDGYCAGISRACVLCNCPGEFKDSILCRDQKQYSAIGWRNNAQCGGDISTAFAGCMQGVFQDPSGAVLAMSIKCCCE